MRDDTKELIDLQRRVWDAANHGRVPELEELLDAEFLLVEADSLERKGKADFLREVGEREKREGEDDVLTFDLASVKVQQVGDLAICYAQFHCEDEVDGERLSLAGNAVDVFVRRGEAWRLVGSVYGEVPPFQE